MLETLEKELPQGTIRFGSKVVSIEQAKNLILVHMADGSILKTKVTWTTLTGVWIFISFTYESREAEKVEGKRMKSKKTIKLTCGVFNYMEN